MFSLVMNLEKATTKETEVSGQSPEVPIKKKVHVPALVLMIVGAVFALLFPLVTYVCSTISLVFAIIKRKTHRTTATLVIDTVALAVALANGIYGAILFSRMMQ